MNKHNVTMRLFFSIILLFAITGVSAQQMPERSLVRKGNRQFDKGNYEQSIERYTKALETVPQSFEAGYNLGNALYKVERYDKAEQTIRGAAADSLRADEERAEAFYNLGNAQFKQEQYKEALESYKQSLRLNPTDQQAKYNYAYTKRLLDQNKDDQEQEKDKDKEQEKKDQEQQKQDQNEPKEDKGEPKEDQGQPQEDQQQEQPSQPQTGIPQQEQEQMLDAIQAQEDKTQEKLKEKQGVVVRGKKNW